MQKEERPDPRNRQAAGNDRGEKRGTDLAALSVRKEGWEVRSRGELKSASMQPTGSFLT
jgi:hypothetical protein